jgi:uncharacterized protein (TIGR03435 family)
MSNWLWTKLKITRAILLTAACTLLGGVVLAQTAASAGGTADDANKHLEFEVATVKPHPVGPNDYMSSIDGGHGETYEAKNVPVKSLVVAAFEVPADQVSGGPPWADKDKFDVSAKLSEADWGAIKDQSRHQQSHLRHLMLQSLLKDRFGLQIAHQPKELRVYALTQARGGARLRPAGSPAPPENPEDAHKGYMMTTSQKDTTAAGITNFLEFVLGRTVIDETGLTGKYDFDFKVDAPPRDAPDEGDAPLLRALEDQLGLKLISKKAVVDTIVIEKLELPSAN